MPRLLSDEYKELVKSKIIQAAVKVFSQKGYQGSSIDEIAAKAGMSKSTLYTYFKGKLDILKLISNKQNISEKFQKSFKDLDYPEALEEFFNMMVSIQEGLNVPFELLTLSLHDENLKKIYRDGYNEKLDAFEIFLQNQQEKGIIRYDVDANILAQLLMALSMDISMQLVIGFDEVKIHEKWTKSLQAILE
ncbi:MAG: TetR/AcrR family transcriptional regulator [Methanobacterium sp.]